MINMMHHTFKKIATCFPLRSLLKAALSTAQDSAERQMIMDYEEL
jgi:hypothetical protein